MKKIMLTLMLAIVSSVWTITEAENYRLPSLCDEWNILGIADLDGQEQYFSFTQRLTTDTIINSVRYAKLQQQNGIYLGALREDDRLNIYYIPDGTTHEYLLYAFNAKVGDTFENVWFGGKPSWFPNGCHVKITGIKETTPRTFELSIKYSRDGYEYPEWNDYVWIEGVGLLEGPCGKDCPLDCENDYGQAVLCAYKNGEQIYTSEYGEKFGCNYEETPQYFPEGMKWTTVYWKANGAEVLYDTAICVVQGDTLINGKTYRNIIDGDFIAPIRQEEKKIFVHLNDSDYILYDFGLKVGDSVPSYEWYDPMQGLYLFSESDHVIGIDTITLLDGRKAKEFFYEFRNPAIEYVGDIFFGVLNPLYNQQACTCLDQGQALCCSFDGEPLYEIYPGFCNSLDNNENASDTIPLFIKDNPGSSTVEPVDPNEIVATINGNELLINEYIDTDITLTLSRTSSNNMPANRVMVNDAETFHDSVSVQITEAGIYTIQLTNPEWVYMIEGTFKYPKDYRAIEEIDAAVPTIRKTLRDGRLVLQIGNHIYTITGSQIQ